MGICSSCLNPDRHDHPPDDGQEREALLDGDANAQYGSVAPGNGSLATAAEQARARVREPEPDPEAVKRDREEMDRICQGLAGKLIDVSTQSTVSRPSAQINPSSTPKPASNTPARPDFSRLLDATFADSESSSTAKENSTSLSNHYGSVDPPNDSDSSATDQTDAVEHATKDDDGQVLERQKEWLRKLMSIYGNERSSDWTKVQSTQNSLVTSLEDFE